MIPCVCYVMLVMLGCRASPPRCSARAGWRSDLARPGHLLGLGAWGIRVIITNIVIIVSIMIIISSGSSSSSSSSSMSMNISMILIMISSTSIISIDIVNRITLL